MSQKFTDNVIYVGLNQEALICPNCKSKLHIVEKQIEHIYETNDNNYVKKRENIGRRLIADIN